ncbi:MAG: hypothetical protein AMDU5_GPLC00002G0041 [Thermoplasmatales archaeon Gpl]|nr:MAG: hypothetical protein AMDU5_GPLC00002G0041 [Thermoplasmatales archaeon Gpl]
MAEKILDLLLLNSIMISDNSTTIFTIVLEKIKM